VEGHEVMPINCPNYDRKNDTPESLFGRGFCLVKIVCNGSGARKIRFPFARPMFRKWEATGCLDYDSEAIGETTLVEYLRAAGHYVGVGAWRPKYGRFTVEVNKEGTK